MVLSAVFEKLGGADRSFQEIAGCRLCAMRDMQLDIAGVHVFGMGNRHPGVVQLLDVSSRGPNEHSVPTPNSLDFNRDFTEPSVHTQEM